MSYDLSAIEPIYPDFPEEFRDKLPATFTEAERRNLSGCFCPTCAKELWGCLPAHGNQGDEDKPPLYDIAQLLHKVKQQIEPLKRFVLKGGIDCPKCRSQFTAGNFADLDVIKQQLDEIVKYMEENPRLHARLKLRTTISRYFNKHEDIFATLPPLDGLASVTNSLFFGDSIRGTKYVWESPKHIYSVTGPHGLAYYAQPSYDGESTVCVNTKFLTGTGNSGFFKSMSPKRRAGELFVILLHEQTHAYFWQQLCYGRCEGTESQRNLCRFLHDKCERLFSYVRHRGLWTRWFYTCGHGPAFTMISEQMEAIAIRLLSSWDPYIDGIHLNVPFPRHCRCPNGHCPKPECLFHCCPNQQDQINKYAQEHGKDLKKIDKLVQKGQRRRALKQQLIVLFTCKLRAAASTLFLPEEVLRPTEY